MVYRSFMIISIVQHLLNPLEYVSDKKGQYRITHLFDHPSFSSLNVDNNNNNN